MAINSKSAIICLVPLLLCVTYWFTHPFSQTISSRTFSLTALSPAQKCNIQLASQAINGVILQPGEQFSFNRAVGPRTSKRGYFRAPSYLGPESPPTFGGGICLLSSAVYQLALSTGLSIDERVPHLRTVRTVPPGLDATVWYRQADLRFHNNLSYPVRIYTQYSPNQFTVGFLGPRFEAKRESLVRRLVNYPAPNQVTVCVFRQDGHKDVLVSRDLYRLSP